MIRGYLAATPGDRVDMVTVGCVKIVNLPVCTPFKMAASFTDQLNTYLDLVKKGIEDQDPTIISVLIAAAVVFLTISEYFSVTF